MNCRTGSHARAQLTWSKDGVPSDVVRCGGGGGGGGGGGYRRDIRSVTHKHDTQTFPTGLIDPGCQGSIVSVASDKGTTLYLSNANTTSSRTHMAIKSSTDGGKTWSQGTPVWSGPSACKV